MRQPRLTLSSSRLRGDRSPDGTALARSAAAERAGSTRRPAAKQRLAKMRFPLAPYLFLAPGFVLFVVTILYPIGRALQISLYDWKLLPGAASNFVGLHQYDRELHDPVFWRALVNSLFYMAFTVPLQIVLGLFVAVLLDAKIPGRGLFRALFYLPVVTSWVVVTLLFKFLFSTDAGLVNWTLQDGAHLTSHNIGWLDSRWPAMITIGLLGVWKGVGWAMLVYLAALQGVPKDLKEAAAIDGAGAWRSFLNVTLPSIRLATAFLTVMLVIGGLNVFQSAYVMTNGGPQQQTEVVLSYMYHQAFQFIDFGYGSAIAFTLSILVFIISFAQLRIFRGGSGRVVR
jgi:multiple sugar transport system permease protein